MAEEAIVKNAADEEQVKKAGEREKRGRDQDLSDLRRILEADHGRRFIWKTLVHCGIFTSSFTGNNTTFFNEGRRDVGLKILADVMEAKPEAYTQMAQDAKRGE